MDKDDCKYYFYYYGLFGNVGTAKRTSETPKSLIEIQSHEISKDEFDRFELGTLARLYPFKPVPGVDTTN